MDKLNSVAAKPDFILICETFLNDNNMNNYNIKGYKKECNNRINKKGGGVAILIKDNINYNIVEKLKININNEFESLFIETESSICGPRIILCPQPTFQSLKSKNTFWPNSKD